MSAGGLLVAQGICAAYGDVQALFDVDFRIEAGERVAIVGANGAGKSTFLATLTGAVRPTRGSVSLDGAVIDRTDAPQRARMGVALVPEGRRLFPSLSVEENLRMGAFARRAGPWTLASVYELFPVLAQRRALPATKLSGGQQQMVAIGRALMANPRLLLCDELSLGLAPVVIKDVYRALARVCDGGQAIVFVEQDVELARRMSDRTYCFLHGRVALEGASQALAREQISAAYFGV